MRFRNGRPDTGHIKTQKVGYQSRSEDFFRYRKDRGRCSTFINFTDFTTLSWL